MIFGPIDQVGWASASATRDVLELGARAAAERPAGGGEDDRLDRLGCAPLEALEDRGVLAVDREQQAAPAALRGDRELAGRDEALLVRERERDAALERPERRPDAGEADDRVEDDVGLARVEELGGVAADLDVLDAVRGREVVERLRARRERAQLELRAALHDLERLAADRAGRTEESDALARRTGCLTRDGGHGEREDDVEGGRAGPEERVEAIEHAAVPGRGCARSPSPRGRA